MSTRARMLRRTLLALVMMLALVAPTAFAAPAAAPAAAQGPKDNNGKADDLKHPLGDKQRALRQSGLEKVFRGQAVGRGKNKVVEVAKGQYVELARQGEDLIWTVLGEFSDLAHNQIPQPDRSVDNSTIWAPDFSEAYFENLLFSDAPGEISMRNFYKELSANRYTVDGDVTDWGQVPQPGAYYGSNSKSDAFTWLFVRDSVNNWYNRQIAAGKTQTEIDAYLAQFDVWDRYDNDGDGNFNEPDGYIDHFQSVHSGEGEETGGGVLGTDAIWSHRWYAFYNNIGVTGPSPDYLLGGIKIGGTNFWIGDYTVEPENGGVGVFAHEYGHDLGLPDLYDVSGNTGGAENSTGFWTLYSSGSYGSSGLPEDGIGTKPVHMSAYEKIFLDWSNYQVAFAGQKGEYKLGPSTANTKQAQQLVVILPDKQVDFNIGSAYAGSYFYHSGSGNDLDNSMTRPISLPASGPITLSMQARYHIEACWDYAYVEVSTDGGTTFAPIQTSASTNDDENGQNFGFGITGTSGTPKVCDQFGTPVWVPITADLSPYAGQTIQLRFRYWTDGAVVGNGFSVDEIAITGLATDGAESDAGWTYNGFVSTTGTTTVSFFNAYFAENRQYTGYDDSLRTGPYNFGFPDTEPNWVEHFPYQNGLLIWYYDTSFADNGVGDHCASGRCGGLVLPVDAHPDLLIRPDNGLVWRPRIQSYDSTFGLEPTDQICLHTSSTVQQCYGGLPANPVFDDTQSYWVAPNANIGHLGWASVPVPNTGTIIEVRSVSAQGNFMQVQVRPAK